MRLTLFTALLAVAGVIVACGGGGDDGGEAEINPFGLQAQTVASAPDAVALNFAPDGRLFFAEKYAGDIRIVDASGNLLDEPFAHVDTFNWLNLEWGLTGLALDPSFASNHYVYAFYTELTSTGPDGGTPTKPVGTVYIALATPEGATSQRYQFAGGRESIKWQSTQMALDLLRRHLLRREAGG